MDRADYKRDLKDRQERLNLVQQAMLRQNERGIVVFEGWDAAGKGSTIRRIAWCLDPRSLHVWSISAPTQAEINGHWLKRAYREINEFEWSLAEEGYWIVKIFLDISPETQLHRLKSRLEAPTKRWKLTEEDIRNRSRWDAYKVAYNEMIETCSPKHAPWHVIDANSKQEARIACFDQIIARFSQGLDIEPPDVSPMIRTYLKNA